MDCHSVSMARVTDDTPTHLRWEVMVRCRTLSHSGAVPLDFRTNGFIQRETKTHFHKKTFPKEFVVV